jgi:hypothetical protein
MRDQVRVVDKCVGDWPNLPGFQAYELKLGLPVLLDGLEGEEAKKLTPPNL